MAFILGNEEAEDGLLQAEKGKLAALESEKGKLAALESFLYSWSACVSESGGLLCCAGYCRHRRGCKLVKLLMRGGKRVAQDLSSLQTSGADLKYLTREELQKQMFSSQVGFIFCVTSLSLLLAAWIFICSCSLSI